MDISTQDLERAVAIRRQIDSLEKQLASLFGNRSRGGAAARAPRAPSERGKRFSAATRAKLAAAARARWARIRAGKSGGGAPKKKQKRGLTAEGRRRLSQLMKARWAARRKAAGKG
jgi:hypothetical protein